VLHCNRSRAETEALAAELDDATVVTADLADREAPDALLAACPHPPTLLVNNASLFEEDRLADFEPAGWDRHMAVNLRAPALLTRAFARHLPAGAAGLVVNLTDAKLAAPNPDYFSYTLSKMGLAGLTELAARALAPAIRVNAIAPAVTLVSGPQSRANFEAAHVMNPLGVGVDVSHLVAALRYLVETPSVTGQTLVLDSGQRFLALPRDVAYMVNE
jgi:NAD(P)-dependent dehydrogenase (short-subunit alcohol dehydrogenase family)